MNQEKIYEKKIAELEKELNELKNSGSNIKEFRNWIFTKFMLGKKLEQSLTENIKEIRSGKIPNDEQLGNLTASILKRLFRIHLVTFFIALVPLLLLFQQNRILSSQTTLFEKQNEKLDNQNELLSKQNEYFDKQNLRLDQQTYLLESQRRSSLSFEFNSILNNINNQLEKSDRISNSLKGRIIAISRSLKPYKYLNNNGKLIEKPLSPERGQLLIALTNSDIKKSQLQEIFESGDFSYSDLGSEDIEGGLILKEINFAKINLKKSNLRNVQFYDCTFTDGDISKSDLFSTFFTSCILDEVDLSTASLSITHFRNTSLQDTEFGGNYCNQLRFKDCFLPRAEYFFDYSNVKSNIASNVNLEGAFVPNKNWLYNFANQNTKGQYNGKYYLRTVKRLIPNGSNELVNKYQIEEDKTYKNTANLTDETVYYKIIEK